MKEIKLDCNPKYTIREDGVVISYMYNKPRVMKTYKNKHGADIVDIRVNGKYKHVHIKTNNIIEQDIELQKHNDSLKFKVNNLDSIKNAKVLEVEILDDDSTINLFYNLIK